jgi:hypothetical protein
MTRMNADKKDTQVAHNAVTQIGKQAKRRRRQTVRIVLVKPFDPR